MHIRRRTLPCRGSNQLPVTLPVIKLPSFNRYDTSYSSVTRYFDVDKCKQILVYHSAFVIVEYHEIY